MGMLTFERTLPFIQSELQSRGLPLSNLFLNKISLTKVLKLNRRLTKLETGDQL